MALCAMVNGESQVVIVNPQPTDITTCALLVPTSGDDLNNPFNLSVEDGSAIAGAIASLWIAAFAFRVLICLVNERK
jgi:hypothetical protein